MKKIYILVVVILLEILMGFAFCKGINTHKYDSWMDTTAIVKDIHVENKISTGTRNNQKNHCTMFIDYLDISYLIRFDNYYPNLETGDKITVLYNPKHEKDVVYLPYEEHCIAVKKRNTILLFLGAICITLVMYFANRKEN